MRTNLTKPEAALVGRAAERDALLAMLRGERRAVTITGPAGAGKTRLAVEVAGALAAEARLVEIWRCDLGEAEDAAALCDAVAETIGAAAAGPTADPAARVALALEARGDVLLVLDELERAAGFAADVLERWLAAAPSLAVLITSRQPLGIAGEAVLELGPLPLPAAGAAPSGAAIDLFVMCTQRVRPAYTLTPEDAPFVAALVRELDGLPLAIELCAPRMAVMGARALLHRMSSRFDVLRKKAARPNDRHATLALAIDASFGALSPAEQSALAQCAVFRGGFTLESAEAVVDLSGHPGAPAALDVIQTLRERSLLHAAPAPGLPGELRLGMLASVRAFALERLDPAARAAAEARHAHHVVRAAEEHERHLAGRDGPERRARILAERDNLTLVIERALGRGPVTASTAEPALRALLVLADLSPYDGPIETLSRVLDPVLAATRDSGADPRLSARALFARGSLLLSRGDARAAGRDLVQALSVARTLGDAALEARATLGLGHALALRGDVQAAADHFQRAADASTRLGDPGGAASALASLADLAARGGRAAEALALTERALSLHRARADPLGEAADLLLVGRLAADRGDHAGATGHFTASLAAARAARSRRAQALATGWLGFAMQLEARRDEAAAAYEAASAELAELGLVPAEALFQGLLGVLLRERGAPGEAFARLSLACDRLAAGTDGDPHHALFLCHLAWLDADVGRARPASELLARAQAILDRAPDPSIAAVLGLAAARLDPSREPAALAAAAALAPASAHVRVALGCRPAQPVTEIALPAPPAGALVIGPAALWFRPPHGERVPLDRRRQLARILDRLADERLARPGAALGWDALLAAAWPGERVLPEAAAHRVRVAVSTLRKLGLRDLLRTTEDGYLLVPEVPAIRAA